MHVYTSTPDEHKCLELLIQYLTAAVEQLS
jgi:hypothetical protein